MKSVLQRRFVQTSPATSDLSNQARLCSLMALGIFLLLLLASGAHAERVAQLKPQGYVNDFAGVINAQTSAQLTAICSEVDHKAHAQISVVTIKTLEGLEASVFGNQLYKKWGIGYKGENRGVLILLATDDHKYWTEIGYGLEPILPDGKVGGFGREMVPRLRAGDYNGGVLHLTAQIAEVIATDRGVKLDSLSKIVQPPEPQSSGDRNSNNSPFFPGGLILLGIIALIINAVIRFFKAIRRGGSWTGGGSGIFFGGGGFGGGGFSGGGGFGGFGGGSSGGGGAGGSW